MTWAILRVKNEARWIARVIASIRPVCEKILILDDHSTDGTPAICRRLACQVFDSTFEGIDESRDKNFLIDRLWNAGAQIGDVVIAIDGDELLNPADLPLLIEEIEDTKTRCWSFPIVYLWDREDQIRVDRWYSNFHRPSMFRLTSFAVSFQSTGFGGNFHCGNVPAQLTAGYRKVPIRLLHFGYLHREDRIRKFEFYNRIDPNNIHEARYEHIIIGDLPEFPATMTSKWAGPLELRPSPFRTN